MRRIASRRRPSDLTLADHPRRKRPDPVTLSLHASFLLPWSLAVYALLGCVACMRWQAPARALLLVGVAGAQALLQSTFLSDGEAHGVVGILGFAAFPLLTGGVAALLPGGTHPLGSADEG